MEKYTIPHTDLTVSRVALGTWVSAAGCGAVQTILAETITQSVGPEFMSPPTGLAG